MPEVLSFQEMDAGPSPADEISGRFRKLHCIVEACNLLPCLYLTISFALLPRSSGCEPHVVKGRTYDNPCDLYAELEMAGHWLLLVSAAASHTELSEIGPPGECARACRWRTYAWYLGPSRS
jgi:hypothetical protein